MGEKRGTYSVLVGKREGDSLEELTIAGRIILK